LELEGKERERGRAGRGIASDDLAYITSLKSTTTTATTNYYYYYYYYY